MNDDWKKLFQIMGWAESCGTASWDDRYIRLRDANTPDKTLYYLHKQILNDLLKRIEKITTETNKCDENNVEKDWSEFRAMVAKYTDFMNMISNNRGYYNHTDKSIDAQFKNYFQQFASKE